MQKTTFFQGLKIVELASVLAGPAVGLFFAELGAEVIKIENRRTGGDVTRRWKLPSEDQEAPYSAYYCSVNWNKQSRLLDLTQEEDRKEVENYILTADIVISNFKTDSAVKLGMDYARLKMLNPGLIYAQLTAFGEDSQRPAFDIVLQAEAGFLYMTGEATREPVRMPVALIDLLAAHQLKEAILVALLHRERTGEGSYVSTSLLEAALSSLANQATNWLMGNHIPQRMGTEHPNIAPYGDIFYAKDDKPLTLAVGTEKQFENLCRSLESEELMQDKMFKTNRLRVLNRQKLKAELNPLIAQFTRAELSERWLRWQVPFGSIRNMQEVFTLPKAREMILEETGSDGRVTQRVKSVAFDWKM